ncbi:putative short-subunit dehydrogenase-like oxidoreductase (DUF2520 family) [Siphonobacter sp. SORGH_AS 1065]|nr:Rossmann-like and DUF2520 domain-containing protein [Siphonobacter sp. SORGH_AS_1065]MDQ1086966.1 putative short-subunit dehydrogenase-like oxidoreductase (DUF2520 family) [Siphonobacter sp. SORGH_AS_1065]
MKMAFIGAGNVAHHLAVELERAHHEIVFIYSRNPDHAEELTEKLALAYPMEELDFSETEVELFFLTTSDDAIKEIIPQIVWPENAVIVHTAGAMPLTSLREQLSIYSDVEVKAGVFYPLQSISKKVELNWTEVPLCIEGEDEGVETLLIEIAKSISEEVYLINSSERLRLHLAAVWANNFPNHLWAITKELLAEQNLDFDLMRPIIKETFRKAMEAEHPAEVQTGPARRGDQSTMQKHQLLLEEQPQWSRLYSILSESIMQWYL